jgi:phosphoglycerate dehydrogenase-like enzyme
LPQPKVVITDTMADELAPEREALGAGIRLDALDARREEDLAGRIEDADAVIVYQLTLSRPTIARLERCRVFVRGESATTMSTGRMPASGASRWRTSPTTAPRRWPTRRWA